MRQVEDQPGDDSGPTAARGEAAWKEITDGVAERNAKAQRAGRAEREAYERDREKVRRATDERRRAGLARRRTGR